MSDANVNACELCDSEWGNHWSEIGGKRLFFCCEICAIQYGHLVKAILMNTSWVSIDHIDTSGTSRGRSVTAYYHGEKAEFIVSFQSDGNILKFRRI
ncbi:MAG: TA0938 family protein [Candidatus Kariarchaeaceae archaeon]|jgi:hypothetical protein